MELESYHDKLSQLVKSAEYTDGNGTKTDSSIAINWIIKTAVDTVASGKKLIFIGNGGSAGIASHMATDWSKNGNLRSVCLNDSSMLTCLSNDYGYEHVYSKQIEFYAQPHDFLIAISSSGNSKNILNAINAARVLDCRVLCLSGFKVQNNIHNLGDMNVHVKSDSYGFVELGHLMILHSALDKHTAG